MLPNDPHSAIWSSQLSIFCNSSAPGRPLDDGDTFTSAKKPNGNQDMEETSSRPGVTTRPGLDGLPEAAT
jgi:hypothetical protein